MKKAIIGKKIGMMRFFYPDGNAVAATVIEILPNVVTNKKTLERDGYNAIQLGYEDVKEKKLSKPVIGQFKENSLPLKRKLQEFRIENTENYSVGDEIKLDSFQEGEFVDVTGISKGKGFAGAIKRWNSRRNPMSHGCSVVHRQAGSMGNCSDPSRVFKGKHAPGHLGVEKVTVQNLEIIKIDTELNAILIKGAIPGAKKSLVTIKNTVKNTVKVKN